MASTRAPHKANIQCRSIRPLQGATPCKIYIARATLRKASLSKNSPLIRCQLSAYLKTGVVP